LDEESSATTWGSIEGCCSCEGARAPLEHKLPKAMAAYDLSS
jgi:hypothetical protein